MMKTSDMHDHVRYWFNGSVEDHPTPQANLESICSDGAVDTVDVLDPGRAYDVNVP